MVAIRACLCRCLALAAGASAHSRPAATTATTTLTAQHGGPERPPVHCRPAGGSVRLCGWTALGAGRGALRLCCVAARPEPEAALAAAARHRLLCQGIASPRSCAPPAAAAGLLHSIPCRAPTSLAPRRQVGADRLWISQRPRRCPLHQRRLQVGCSRPATAAQQPPARACGTLQAGCAPGWRAAGPRGCTRALIAPPRRLLLLPCRPAQVRRGGAAGHWRHHRAGVSQVGSEVPLQI